MKLILSISGGGIRGIIPAIIIANIERRVGKSISQCFDLISGTSTGGIIAALLAAPGENGCPKYKADEVVELYKQFGKQIFSRNFVRKLLTIDGLISTKYSCRILEKLLKKYLGCTLLSQSTTNLLIPAYQISNVPYPHFFKTSHAKRSNDRVKNPRLWECVRATSAANGYFKPYKLCKNYTFLDGSVFANNPAVCAYAQAKSMYGNQEKIVIVSVGTGEDDLIGYSYEKIRNWGMVQWAIPFFKQTSISANETVDYMLRKFTVNGDKYFCFKTKIDKQSLKMDDVSNENILKLESAAIQTVKQNQKQIDQIVEILSQIVPAD